MTLVVLAQLRFLWRTRGSLLSALLGMTIGVASVTGVHLLSAEIAQRVEDQARPFGPADLYLRRAVLEEEDYFALRKRWRAGELQGVAAIFPLVEGPVELNDETYMLVGTDALALAASGRSGMGSGRGSGPAAGALPGAVGERYGRWLTSNSVFLPRGDAESISASSVELGDNKVEVLGFSAPFRVLLADLPTAQTILGQELTRIGVVLEPQSGVFDLGETLRSFFASLFPGALAKPAAAPLAALDSSWLQIPAEADNPTQQLLRSVLFNVAALSVLALVVAWLLTYQVACHALGRRRSMFLRLQSLGVSRARLQRLTLIEGVVLGLAATAAGLVLGFWLANSLLAAALGGDGRFELSVDPFVWFKALISGIGVAGWSYLLAANRSLFASHDNQQPVPQFEQTPGPARGWGMLLALLAIFFWGLAGNSLIGAFACIVVCALALLIYLPVLARRLWNYTRGLPVARTSPLKVLGVRQVLHGQELRLGVSALALALATALGISVMVESFRGAFLEMLDQRLSDDLVVVVTADGRQKTPQLPPAVELELQNHAATSFWRGAVVVSALGVDGELEFADGHSELLQRFVGAQRVTKQALVAKSVFLNESFARSQQLDIGAAVELSGAKTAVVVRLAGVFPDYGDTRPRILGRRSLAVELNGEAPLQELYVRTPRSVELQEALRGVARELQSGSLKTGNLKLRVRDQQQVREQSIQVFEQTFAITRALTWLALLVAVVALANALAAHTLQQQGTARQLRVLGLARTGQLRLLRARTLYVGAAALLLAIPLGLAIAGLLCLVVNPRAFGWSFAMQLTPGGVGWPLAGGVLGVLVAALLGGVIARRETPALARSPAWLAALAVIVMVFAGCSADNSAAGSDQAGAAGTQSSSVAGLRVGSVLGGQADGYARATEVQEFVFPRDHGAHPNYKSEWWYLTCPLAGVETGAEYGVQFTLFRQALAPPAALGNLTNLWRNGQVYMAHAALTAVNQGQHVESSRFARGHPELAGVSTEPFAAWLEDWRLSAPQGIAPHQTAPQQGDTQPAASAPKSRATEAGSLARLNLAVRAKEFGIALDLQQVKPRVLQGDRGLSYKGSSEASYYYSLPRLSASGSVQLGATSASEAVSGNCWLDREWSTSVLADSLVGWDWFALQLDEGTDYMLFQLRDSAEHTTAAATAPVAEHPKRQGKEIAANGGARSLLSEQLRFEVLSYWRDEEGNDWPVEWRVSIGERELRIVAALEDQRMRSTIAYWEGLVWVFEEEQRIGQGYLEMTGYSVN